MPSSFRSRESTLAALNAVEDFDDREAIEGLVGAIEHIAWLCPTRRDMDDLLNLAAERLADAGIARLGGGG